MNPRHRAFTLIELLVVIAIIAILAAILFPVFAQATEKARQTTCLSDLKQLGSATLTYAQDYDETLPGATEGAAGVSKLGGWTYLVAFGSQGAGSFAPQRGALFPYLKNGAVFRCPSDPSRTAQSYAINGCVTQGPNGSGMSRGEALAKFPTPASLLLFSEEGTPQGGTNDGFLHPAWDSLALRHQGRATVVYLDGHARADGAMTHWFSLLGGAEPACW